MEHEQKPSKLKTAGNIVIALAMLPLVVLMFIIFAWMAAVVESLGQAVGGLIAFVVLRLWPFWVPAALVGVFIAIRRQREESKRSAEIAEEIHKQQMASREGERIEPLNIAIPPNALGYGQENRGDDHVATRTPS